MAKQLKAIKCPQCGSVQKTEIKPDHFRCNSCGTEYFLDNDDINVNVNVHHSYNTPTGNNPLTVKKSNPKKLLIGLAIGFGVLILASIILAQSLFKTIGNRINIHKERKDYALCFPVASQEKLLVFALYSKDATGAGNNKQACYGAFIDAETNEEVKEIALPEITNFHSTGYHYQQFSDGLFYIIVNQRSIYTVNPIMLTVEDATKRILQSDPAFSAGVSIIERGYKENGESFTITTNTGQSVVFYPLTGQKYQGKSVSNYRRHLSLPATVDSTLFEFTVLEKNPPHRDKYALVSSHFKYQPGGAGRLEHETVVTPKSGNLTDFFKRPVKYLPEVTPGRIFFEPANVLCGSLEDLVIAYHSSPAEDSDALLQRLDTKTGEILWSTPVMGNQRHSAPRWLYDQTECAVARAGNRYLIHADNYDFILVDADNGTIIREFSIF